MTNVFRIPQLRSKVLRVHSITYSSAIRACENGHQPQNVLHLVQEMQLRGLAPRITAYVTLLDLLYPSQMDPFGSRSRSGPASF